MKRTEIRAVVRRVDLPARNTGWFASGDLAIVADLVKMLPPVGETFMVVWQEREVTPDAIEFRPSVAAQIPSTNLA
jgi:hypothetical protein